ncbi:phosphoserine phosphatase SerB [Altericroceibacterium spongiae]|uniref:Phosphoserine phosphatase n=1 Tax=Altericroceibacterium spongiae TaxID=2320269 RepID=A0A420ECJ9_9SPHN|nr:phosphoserine phosphatase SerB [Altericroceibacterium spongiae]RKF18384.1 phosphoserine phosphatase SerB [Altericroceibacterium spongiae]
MLIARLIADQNTLKASLDAASGALAAEGLQIANVQMLDFCGEVLQLMLPEGDPAVLRRVIDTYFVPSDVLMSDREINIPNLFVSDMDSTMIGQECIDELADFAGIKDKIAGITERAMQGELDFESALRERVGLLEGLEEDAIDRCLAERIKPMSGAQTLVATLKSYGCHTVLVTGGFHHFADRVAHDLGFERVVGNRLATANGRLTGNLAGAITDSSVKEKVLLEERNRIGEGAVSLATGDGANDIPMLQAAHYGIAYHAKPKAREAANGWVNCGDLTAILKLLNIPESDWVAA